MKILVVEDEKPTANYLKRGLTEEGFAVDVASNSEEADASVAVYSYDAILLDVMLPGQDGFELCHNWRKQGITSPILFLTARDEVSDRVHGLDIGGDDYLMKPFSFDELLARIRAMVRRAAGSRNGGAIHLGDLVVETGRREVKRCGQLVSLTNREYQLLEYLALHLGQVVSRTELWEHVWDSGDEPDSNVVDVYIRYLRNKLGRDPNMIQTVRGMGYMIQNQKQANPITNAEA